MKMWLSFVRFQMRKTIGHFPWLSCLSSTEAMNLGWNLWPSFLEASNLILIYPVMTKISPEIKVQTFMDFICMHVILFNKMGKGTFKFNCWDWRIFTIKELTYIISTFWVGFYSIVLSFTAYSSLSSDVLSNHIFVIPKCTEASLGWWDMMLKIVISYYTTISFITLNKTSQWSIIWWHSSMARKKETLLKGILYDLGIVPIQSWLFYILLRKAAVI